MTPEIGTKLAIALCEDRYTGEPALDNPLWQGATETSRSAYHEEWAFCWSPVLCRISAQHESGAGAVAFCTRDVAVEWEEA